MANKVVKTRIKNRYDLLSKWQETGVELLQGEIALVAVPTGTNYTNPVTGKDEPVVELLMKVGQKDSQGNPIAFENLPWLSAKASDVYDWAKLQDPGSVTVKYKDGSTDKSTTLADLFKKVNTEAAALDTVEAAVANFINSVSQTTTAGVVTNVAIDANNKHQLNVTRGQVTASLIASNAVETAKIKNAAVETSKIKDAAVTTDKIDDEAVTNDKLAGGIATSKIAYTDKKTLETYLGELDQALSTMDTDVLSKISIDKTTGTGVMQGLSYSNGTFSATYDTVQTGDIANSAVTAGKIATSAVETAKIKDSAVTDAKIDSVSASKVVVTAATGGNNAVMLPAKLQDLSQGISALQDAIAGGTHFRGELAAAPTNIRKVLKKNGDASKDTDYITAAAGDIVLFGEKEYICTDIDATKEKNATGSATWKELGDLSRVGTLETLTGSLHASSATANQFVTYIKKDNGVLKVQTAQPTAADVKYGDSSTVKKAIEDLSANKVDTTDARLSDARTPLAHSQASNTINVMTGYSKPSSTSAIAATDTLNAAIGKLEKALDGKGTSNLTLGTTSTTAAKGDHGHTDLAAIKASYIKYNETDATNGVGVLKAVYNDTEFTLIFDCGGASV